ASRLRSDRDRTWGSGYDRRGPRGYPRSGEAISAVLHSAVRERSGARARTAYEAWREGANALASSWGGLLVGGCHDSKRAPGRYEFRDNIQGGRGPVAGNHDPYRRKPWSDRSEGTCN